MRARTAAFGVLVVLLTVSISAQIGSITGVARDAQGLALPGVTVEVASPALIEKVRTTVTGDDGRYRIVALPPGTYTVTFTLDGFQTFQRTAVDVVPDVNTSIDARMQVGHLTETVHVTARAPAIDVVNANMTTRFTGEELQDLPGARNPSSLPSLVPGITTTAGATAFSGGVFSGGVGVWAPPDVANFNNQTSIDGVQGRLMINGVPVDSSGGSITGATSGHVIDASNAAGVAFSLSGQLGASETGGTAIDAVETPNREAYAAIVENAFRRVGNEPLSTFSIDVDTASYANVRRFLNEGRLPPADAVRVEELVNYFRFDYPQPTGRTPFSITTELAEAPWNPRHRLALVGLQGRALEETDPAPRNLVFLLDVSGSMASADKLPLVRNAMRLLVDVLEPQDRVAIVVYAGASGLVLPSTTGDRKAEIHAAIERLQSAGSTNGAAGIRLAYRIAREHFIPGGVNRVILATDGDFNVGITSLTDLVALIEQERQSGVFLSVLGVGTGNLQDATMERLADTGNGNYSYLDSLQEARKVLVKEAGSTLVTIAKDVKIQIEFNPATVAAYRLIGYENRLLANQDFDDDLKDAGEIGAGHSVTALYEIVPVAGALTSGEFDDLKYQPVASWRELSRRYADELMTVKLRYKQPDGDRSRLVSAVVMREPQPMTANLGFASAVAEFGMLLRGSPHAGASGFETVGERARRFLGSDPEGYRMEFVKLSELAGSLRALEDARRQSSAR